MFSLVRLIYQITKELLKMTFTTESRIAQSYAILILAGKITIEDVPNVGNLREVVTQIITA